MIEKTQLIQYLDLRGTPCPINFVRCRLVLEELNKDQYLKVQLDKGEPEETVFSGLSNAGYTIKTIESQEDSIVFLVKSIGK